MGTTMRGWRRFVLVAVGLVALVAASCSSEINVQREGAGDDGSAVPTPTPDSGTVPTPGPVGPTPSPDGQAAWTVLVYVLADNDLEPFAVEDVLEMASVGSTDEVNIVAMVDRAPGYSDAPMLNIANFEETKVFHVQRGSLTDLSTEPVELNMGDPATLAGFISGGIENFPADRYAVIIWDHGAGWPGIGPDETDGFDVLDLADLEVAMRTGLEEVGLDKVDLLGFDACLMATYEVASALAPYADYMLSSQELEPGHGWNYASLQVLVDDPSTGPVELAAAIQEGFVAQAQQSGTGGDLTLSLLDLTAIGPLQDELGRLTELVLADPVDAGPWLGSVRSSALVFGDNPNPALSSNLVDLGLLLDGLGPDGAPARAALDAMVVSQITGPARASATGMSVYFPSFADEFRQGYLFLEGVPHWPDLLEAYYTAGQAIPPAQQPQFIAEGRLAEYFFDEDGLNIFGFFDLAAQGNIVAADIYYGVVDETDGSIYVLGREDGEVATDGSGLAAAIFNLDTLQIDDGVDTAYAYLDLTFDFETGFALAYIPLAYAPPGVFDERDYVDVVLSLVVDPFTELIESYVFYKVDELGNWGEIILDPDGFIYPIALHIYPDGSSAWEPTLDIGLYADYDLLNFNLVTLPSGTLLYAELLVTDFGGNSDWVFMEDYIP